MIINESSLPKSVTKGALMLYRSSTEVLQEQITTLYYFLYTRDEVYLPCLCSFDLFRFKRLVVSHRLWVGRDRFYFATTAPYDDVYAGLR